MSSQVTEKSAGSHPKLPALPTMMLVPMYCLVNAEEPQQDVYPLSTQQDEPDNIQSNTSSWDPRSTPQRNERHSPLSRHLGSQ